MQNRRDFRVAAGKLVDEFLSCFGGRKANQSCEIFGRAAIGLFYSGNWAVEMGLKVAKQLKLGQLEK